MTGAGPGRRRLFPAGGAVRRRVFAAFFFVAVAAVLAVPALPEAAGTQPEDEAAAMRMTVRMGDEGRFTATTRVRVPAGEARPAFRRLARSADGFRAEPLLPTEETEEELRFETVAFAADDGWVRLPTPLPVSGPALSFAAELTPPPGQRFADLFPAPRGTSGGVTRVFVPAPPSLIRFRLVPADASGWGLATLVDAAALSLLLGLGGVGAFRLFRSGAKEDAR